MIRMRKSFTWLCIGLVLFVAVTSGVAGELAALLTPLWLLCADFAARVGRRAAGHRNERLLSLLAPVSPRAPPVRFAPVRLPSY